MILAHHGGEAPVLIALLGSAGLLPALGIVLRMRLERLSGWLGRRRRK